MLSARRLNANWVGFVMVENLYTSSKTRNIRKICSQYFSISLIKFEENDFPLVQRTLCLAFVYIGLGTPTRPTRTLFYSIEFRINIPLGVEYN